jgi:hypothetical protein
MQKKQGPLLCETDRSDRPCRTWGAIVWPAMTSRLTGLYLNLDLKLAPQVLPKLQTAGGVDSRTPWRRLCLTQRGQPARAWHSIQAVSGRGLG